MQTHVYLWRHFLETQERVQPGVGPEYALKTRTASAICRVGFLHQLTAAIYWDEPCAAHLFATGGGASGTLNPTLNPRRAPPPLCAGPACSWPPDPSQVRLLSEAKTCRLA